MTIFYVLFDLMFVENIEFSDNSVNELWDKIDFLDTVSNDISLAQKLIDEYIAQTRILLMQAKDALYHNNFEYAYLKYRLD